jgi:hypothetical protein
MPHGPPGPGPMPPHMAPGPHGPQPSDQDGHHAHPSGPPGPHPGPGPPQSFHLPPHLSGPNVGYALTPINLATGQPCGPTQVLSSATMHALQVAAARELANPGKVRGSRGGIMASSSPAAAAAAAAAQISAKSACIWLLAQ